MAKNSIGEMHMKITANGQQAVTELARVDNTVRRSVGRAEAELGKMATAIQRKFSAVDIGKSVLGGIGLGSGFAVATSAVDMVTQYYREQAEHAKSIADSTERQLNLTRQIVALNQTDEQKRKGLQDDYDAVVRELEAARAAKFETRSYPVLGPNGVAMQTDRVSRADTIEEQAKVNKLAERERELKLELAKLNKADRDDNTAERMKEIDSGVRSYLTTLDAKLRAEHAQIKVAGERAGALHAEIEGYKDLADPMREYYRQLDAITKREKEGLLTAEEARLARKTIVEGRYGGGPNNSGVSIMGQGVATLHDETELTTDAARDLGFAFSSAFEDAIIDAQKLDDVIRGLAQDILRMGLRMGVTNPLLNAVFGGVSGWSALPSLFGGARADGGPVTSGTAYMVGEEGPEMFVPRSSGAIVPNHKLSGTAGGDTFVFSPQIASGVTRQELAGILPPMFERFAGMVTDKVQRGGAYRKAFA